MPQRLRPGLILLLPQYINIGLLVRVLRMKILVRNLLDVKHVLGHFPEQFIGLRRPHLITEQHDAIVSHQSLHGGHQRTYSLLDVNDVGGNDVIERWVQGSDLVGVVPIEDRVLEGFGEYGFVAFEVVFECGHDGGYVRKDEVSESKEVEPHASGPASCAKFNGTFAAEIEEVIVGVVAGGWVWGEWGPAVDEFDKDEGARPDGGADVHGAVVLLEGKERVAHGQLDNRRICELHCGV